MVDVVHPVCVRHGTAMKLAVRLSALSGISTFRNMDAAAASCPRTATLTLGFGNTAACSAAACA
jgi:hypothetical protein